MSSSERTGFEKKYDTKRIGLAAGASHILFAAGILFMAFMVPYSSILFWTCIVIAVVLIVITAIGGRPFLSE